MNQTMFIPDFPFKDRVVLKKIFLWAISQKGFLIFQQKKTVMGAGGSSKIC